MRRPRLFGWGFAGAVGGLCGLFAQRNWMTVQLFLHGGSFGSVDPEFGHDIGFYVFDLPFYRMVLSWLFVAACLALLVSLVTHYLFGGIRLPDAKPRYASLSARIQLAVLPAPSSRSRRSPTGSIGTGCSRAAERNRHSPVPATPTSTPCCRPSSILLAIAVICAVSFFAAIILRDLRIPAMATALLVLSSIVVGGAWPLAMEQFSVARTPPTGNAPTSNATSPRPGRPTESTRTGSNTGTIRVSAPNRRATSPPTSPRSPTPGCSTRTCCRAPSPSSSS